VNQKLDHLRQYGKVHLSGSDYGWRASFETPPLNGAKIEVASGFHEDSETAVNELWDRVQAIGKKALCPSTLLIG
jgi:hypothetical protein